MKRFTVTKYDLSAWHNNKMPPSFRLSVKRAFDWVLMSGVCLTKPCPNVWRGCFHALLNTENIFIHANAVSISVPALHKPPSPPDLQRQTCTLRPPPPPPLQNYKHADVQRLWAFVCSIMVKASRNGNENKKSKIDLTCRACLHAFKRKP